jgi:YVTN family beta-propeller protein
MNRKPLFFVASAIALLGIAYSAKRAADAGRLLPNRPEASGATTLPNGWRITPAGKQIDLPGDLPMKMQVTPDGASLLVQTGGFHDHSLSVIDLAKQKSAATIDLVKTWDGMAFNASTGDIFLSGGGPGMKGFAEAVERRSSAGAMKSDLNKPVLHVRFVNGKLEPAASVTIAGLDEKSRFISGLTLGPDGSLYALNIQTDTLYKLSGQNFAQQSSVKTGYRPHSAVFSPDSRTLAISNWGDESVSLLDPANLRETGRVKVGSHPNEMVWAKDGRLFVANAGSNTVSVLKGAQVTETIRTSMDPKALVGSTPVALALSPDQTRLFIANADNNNVAVVDIGAKESSVAGFIPTGWYPTALAVSQDGRQLFVGTGKGMGFRNNYPAASQAAPRRVPNPETPYDYIGDVLSGHVSIVEMPDAKALAAYTKQAVGNVPSSAAQVDSALAARVRKDVFPKIKHVLYIIRENRTYDQVLGDLGTGNGDPKLTLFGEKITPNGHALARKFVTLDNLYCDGEVSEDGHQWSTASYATDFNQKAWTNSYSKRGEPESDERLMDSPAGYLWDNCARHNKTFRTYGEMAAFTSTPDEEPRVKATGSLTGHASLEWLKLKNKGARDPQKVEVFVKELKEAEKTGEWPNFMVMALGEDHTQGLTPGAFTPQARVASNDQALGQIVEAVSSSKFWKETAIFVIEDDAQNGPDHVDAHRTVGLMISPWIKRGVVDSTMYTTSSMVRTMELILGLPPMTQFDAAATPMYFSFTSEPLLEPVKLLGPKTDLMTKNPATGPGALASLKLDFSDVDRADPDELNRILWAAIRPGGPMPAPVRSLRLR